MIEKRIQELERLYQTLEHQISRLTAGSQQLAILKSQQMQIWNQLRDARRQQWNHDQDLNLEDH